MGSYGESHGDGRSNQKLDSYLDHIPCIKCKNGQPVHFSDNNQGYCDDCWRSQINNDHITGLKLSQSNISSFSDSNSQPKIKKCLMCKKTLTNLDQIFCDQHFYCKNCLSAADPQAILYNNDEFCKEYGNKLSEERKKIIKASQTSVIDDKEKCQICEIYKEADSFKCRTHKFCDTCLWYKVEIP